MSSDEFEEKYEHLNSLIGMMFDCAESGDYSGVCECGQDAKKEIDKLFTKARNICLDVGSGDSGALVMHCQL